MQIVAYILSGVALHWHGLDECIQTWVAFDCLLCTGKLLQSAIAHSMINDQLTIATTNWPEAKGEEFTGIPDTVNVTNTVLIGLLANFM